MKDTLMKEKKEHYQLSYTDKNKTHRLALDFEEVRHLVESARTVESMQARLFDMETTIIGLVEVPVKCGHYTSVNRYYSGVLNLVKKENDSIDTMVDATLKLYAFCGKESFYRDKPDLVLEGTFSTGQ